MGILSSTVKAFYEIAKNPKLLRRMLDDNRIWENYVTKKYPQFKSGLPVVEIDELIPGFKETIEVVAFLGGGSTPPDLAIIKALCRSFKDCKYFEIGTWRGESVANASEVCQECVTLNLDPDEFANGKYKATMGFFSHNLKNVKQLYGDSRIYDFSSINKKFDVIFIDGDHHHPAIKKDTFNVFNHLMHENSVIIWHDYGLDQTTPRFETLAGIVEGIPEERWKNLYHVSNTLCAVYTNRKLTSRYLQVPEIPNKRFRVTVEPVKV